MSTNSSDDIDGSIPNRRTVLGAIGTTAAAGATLTGVASAARDPADVDPKAAKHADLESFEGKLETVEPEVQDVLEKLSANGHIESAELDALGFDDVEPSTEASTDAITARMSHPPEGEFLAYETLIPTDQFDTDIRVTIRPEQGVAAASAKRDGEEFALTADQSEFVSVESEDYQTACTCSTSSCGTCSCPYGEPRYKECNDGLCCCNSDDCLSSACCEDDDDGGNW